MKLLLVLLMLLYPAGRGSLGIGIDVLPEAFTFAAHRVGFAADLRLVSCNASRCVWDLGQGVTVAAERSGDSLDVRRIEAKLDPVLPPSSLPAARYDAACLAIVALVAPKARAAEQKSAARTITTLAGSASKDIELDLADRSVRLYGALARGDKLLTAKTCGAAAST